MFVSTFFYSIHCFFIQIFAFYLLWEIQVTESCQWFCAVGTNALHVTTEKSSFSFYFIVVKALPNYVKVRHQSYTPFFNLQSFCMIWTWTSMTTIRCNHCIPFWFQFWIFFDVFHCFIVWIISGNYCFEIDWGQLTYLCCFFFR